jgi:hypothetical protein
MNNSRAHNLSKPLPECLENTQKKKKKNTVVVLQSNAKAVKKKKKKQVARDVLFVSL